MRASLLGFCLATTMGIGAAGALHAEESAPLDEVRVTARRLEETLPQELAKYGMRLDIVTREQVLDGAYVDVAQTLQALAPGLYLQPKNGPFDYADISLLGSRTQDVLWLVDGVRINNRLYGTTPPLDTLSSSMVERIEVLEGGQALFYGTSAVAGAVNIVTKPFSDVPEGAVNVAVDTNDSRHLDAYFSDSFRGHHLALYGSTDRSDGYRSFRRQDYQPSDTQGDRGYDVQTFGAKYGYEFNEDLRLSATYEHTDADLDFAQPYRVARNVNSRKEDLATAKLDYTLNEAMSVYLKGYYHAWRTRYDTTYNDLATPGAKDVLYDNAFWGYDDRGINALARFQFTPGVEYYLGYDLQRYGGRDEVLFITQNKEQTQAVFAQVRANPEFIPNTHLSAGVRYNHPDVGQQATVWSATGQYDLSSTLFIRAVVGTNFRLPSAEELFADDPQDERGNPNLKPERSKSLNASIGGTVGQGPAQLRWELIGFARDITDLIDFDQFDQATGQDVFGNVAGTVRVRGGEALIDASFSEDLSANLSYTYNRSRVDGGEQITRIPESLAKASLDYHPAGRAFGATVALNYTGRVFTTVGAQRVRYGNYAVVDVSGRYFIDTDHKNRINLALQNVFDKEYGLPSRGCADVSTDGPYDCSAPYEYVNLGLPRTLRASFTHAF